MGVLVQRTIMPDGEVKEHPFGLKVVKKPISDKEFNARSKNILKMVNKSYGVK